MNRFILVNGPWQLMVVASALKQASRTGRGPSRDTLILFSLPDGPLPAPMLEVMRRIAPAVWPWHRMVVLDEAIRPGLDDPRRCGEAIRALLPEGPPDEVWLDCLWGAPAKLLAEAYPASPLVLYEDGLHSYLACEDHHVSLSRLLVDPRGVSRAIKTRLRERRHPDALWTAIMLPRHLRRVAASYLWVSLMAPPPDYQRRLPLVQLRTSFVQETLAQVSPIVDDIGLAPGGPRALLMGQCFSNYGDLPRDVELACYAGMARQLQEQGYEVIWKEHPRTRRPFLDELSAAIPGVVGAPDWGAWPVELYVERLGLSACAAISSTSLFSLHLLFGLPTFSPSARLVPPFNYPNNELGRIVAGSIPQLPDSEATSEPTDAASASTHPVPSRRARTPSVFRARWGKEPRNSSHASMRADDPSNSSFFADSTVVL